MSDSDSFLVSHGRRSRAAFAWLAGALLTFTAHAGLPVNYRTELSAAWIDNLSRTSAATDQRDGARFTAAASASTFRNWKTGFLTSGGLSATAESVPDFPRAGALTFASQLGLRRKFGLGAYAPVLDLSATAAHRQTRYRPAAGWTSTASARFGKRLTQAWRVATTADWHEHAARSETFNIRHHRLFATVSWDLTPRWQLSYSAGRLWGDFTAHAAPATWAGALAGAFGPVVSNYYRTVARERTDVYGTGWVAYRVRGDATFHWLEIAPALGRNTSLPLRFERISTTNRIGIRYRQDSVTLSLLHRF